MEILMFAASTNTIEGVYDRADFYEEEGDGLWTINYDKVVHIGDYNFDASDDMSSLTITLMNFTNDTDIEFDPHRVTHVIATHYWKKQGHKPWKNIKSRISYSVDSVEYEGSNQLTFHLIEDPVIAHMQELVNTKVLIKRTNDPNLFYLNDVTDVANYHSLNRLDDSSDTSPRNLTGAWVLYTYQVDKDIRLFQVTAKNIDSAEETFSSLSDLRAKYPESITNKPDSFPYYGRIVSIGDDFYQCVYNPKLQPPMIRPRLEWRLIPTITAGNIVPKVAVETYLTPGDVRTVSIAFPVSTAIRVKESDTFSDEDQFLLSAYQVHNIDLVTEDSNVIVGNTVLISRRVITGNMLGFVDKFTPSGIYDETSLYVNRSSQVRIENFTPLNTSPWACVLPYFLTYNKTYSFTMGDEPQFAEPFYKYYLSVFGQNIPLSYRAVQNGIEVSSVISSTNWHVNVHRADNVNDVLWSGDLSPTMLTTLDKFDEYLSQNSTYNQGKWVNTVLGGGTRVVSGALSGFIAGNVPGAIIGAAAGIVSMGQQLANYNLQERAMKDAPDAIRGNSNTYDSTLLIGYGIYLYRMEATSPAIDIMKTELDIKGFEVNHTGYIKDLATTANDTLGPCVYFSGRLLDVIYNYHVTNRITERLEAGIYIKNLPEIEE